ncbi:MAG: ABC transporter ATP-binding protein [Lachnospiraceae bacterium]|nr:ABC transporter ATP-binding protein [Lachnospiraceae bacterium]
MKKLLVYLKDYKKETVLGPLFKLLEASFELIVPMVVAAIIDVGVNQRDAEYITKMCGVMILLGVVGLICSITAQYYAAKAATGFATKLRHSLFQHIQSLSFSEIDEIGTSTLITRMTSDVNQLQSGVNMVLRLFLRSPFIVVGAMIMAFTIDVKAALVFVVTIPVLSVVIFGIMWVSIPLYRKVQESLDRILGITRENLTGIRVIRAFGKEDSELKEFGKRNDIFTELQIKVGKISALMNPLTYMIINLGIMVLIWVGALRVNNGAITQGQVVALYNYMSQILVELIKLANLIVTVTKALACAGRIENVLEMESSMKQELSETKLENSRKCSSEKRIVENFSTKSTAMGNDSIKNTCLKKNAIEEISMKSEYKVVFEQVGMTYKGAGEEALTDISFSVKKGETIGIIGGTGSGKTSMVHLIPRFYDANRGRVLVDGRDVREYSLKELRNKVGIVMQKSVLFHGTIRENICWGKQDATEEEIMQALITAQAKEIVDNKPEGLETVISQGAKNLSGGQKQRLSIARALVRKPEILILDDSASALDYATDAALRKAIGKLEEDMTVFIVSQRASSVMHADKIVVLDDGEIVGIGIHEELKEKCSVYQEIYYSQYEKEEA